MNPFETKTVRTPKFGLAISVLLAGAAIPGNAATLCVNPAGTGGCSTTISAAVAAAAPGGVIQVGRGIYKESVHITKSLTIQGAPGAIIDATGLSTGIFIDGMASAPGAGISAVSVSGMTVKNANFEGILVANALGVTISGNTITLNDRALMPGANATCPGLPAFETNEAADCGEGLHLMGVSYSVISNNTINDNAGGMLISDESGTTSRNVISGNTVANNGYDCGITLASHARAPGLGQGLNFGIYNNTISRNVVSNNGNLGQGAGVGIFAPGPGSINSGNVVVNNVLRDNGLGGVTMHNHAAPGVNGVPAQAPPVNLSDNVIVGNQISGNAADYDDPASPGPTGISILSFAPLTGTVIIGNIFSGEVADVTFNAPDGTLEVHLNSFGPNDIGVAAENKGSIDASMNWWGCPDGPGAVGCGTITGSTVYAPSWMQTPPAAAGGMRPF
jgi:parallel beta-helix repeat protein